MKHITRRSLSIVLLLALMLSTLSPVAFAAQRNTGTRHKLCTSLSSQAVAYYTGKYSPDALISYETDTTGSCLKAVDSELYNVLQQLMTDTHTYEVNYKGDNGLQEYWPNTDCNNGSGKAQLFYSDTTGSFNREHVWPKSRASFYQSEGGSDLHHLRPTNTTVNSTRSNYTFANVREYLSKPSTYPPSGTPTILWYDGSYTENSPEEAKTTDNLGMVEINDNVKGDTARILLYVYTRWEEKNLFENDPNAKPGSSTDENNGLRVIFDLETLLQWCEIDPVDEWEMGRNDATQDVQGNRNVFIDYPELAWLLFGETPPADMDVPEKLPLGMTTYTVTASSNNTAWGTVSVSGRRITATPAEGYYVEGYTLLSGDAEVKRNDNIFTVIAASDCSVRINFAPKKVVTATFNAPGVEPISYYAGESITLPDATAPEGYRFMGWVTETVEDTTVKPSYLNAGSKYTLNGDVEFFALYSYSDGEGFGDWVLVTDASALRGGIQVVLASAENGAVAASMKDTHLTKSNATFVDDGDMIKTLPQDAMIFILGGQADAWTLETAEGKLLGASGNKKLGWDTGITRWKITFNGSDVLMTTSNDSYGKILYNRSSPRFTTYTNSVSSTLVLPQLYTNDGGVIYYTTTPGKCDHSYETVVTDPTCTDDGYTTHTCTKCGHSYKDAVVEALGHSYEFVVTVPTCTEAGYTTFTCTVCGDSYVGDATSALGHSWDEGVVTLAPAPGVQGEMTYTCLTCGMTDIEVIPALPYDGCAYGDQCGSHTFTDMPELDNWAHAGIDFVVNKGLFNGMSKDSFAPGKTMTRAMLVTVLWRSAGEPEADATAFTDVPGEQWYSKAVAWAAMKGVVTGYTDGTFRPDNQITREQLATILFRYTKLTDPDPSERAELDSFPDSEDIQPYAKDALSWAVGKGLINGIYDSSAGQSFLRPAGSATRAQVATILMRFLQNEN